MELADGVEVLRGLAGGSLGGVVAFHVVEHLPAEVLVELLAQAARVIRPGGGIILETPNPENLVVGATTFWLDPTHVRPVPPLLLEFLVEDAGFAEVAIRRLHPSEPLLAPDLVQLVPEAYRAATERLVTLVSGPMDYAVVGRVPVD